jgi:hypothetical protein
MGMLRRFNVGHFKNRFPISLQLHRPDPRHQRAWLAAGRILFARQTRPHGH